MAKIGNFGKLIIFSTSDKKVLTFDGLSQQVSATWVKHETIGSKPGSEFCHADLRSVTFEILFDASLGVKPRSIIEKIEKAIESGQVENLVIGAKKVGKNKWKITKMTESWDEIMNKGELIKAKCKLTLEEYV